MTCHSLQISVSLLKNKIMRYSHKKYCISQAGDRVGVKRRGDGTLHFYVNGIDQGQGATGVPPNVYGVIDLYGQAAQTTIIDHLGNNLLRTVH